MCSGITRSRMLNGELYAQRFQNLIYLHLLRADKLTSEIFVDKLITEIFVYFISFSKYISLRKKRTWV